MKLMIDTNIILDIMLKREPFFNASYSALTGAIGRDIECMISTSAVTDLFYLLRKAFKSSEKARQTIGTLTQTFSLAAVTPPEVNAALISDIADFEDAVVDAVALHNKASYIITRNTRDYASSSVPAIAPEELLPILENA